MHSIEKILYRVHSMLVNVIEIEVRVSNVGAYPVLAYQKVGS